MLFAILQQSVSLITR